MLRGTTDGTMVVALAAACCRPLGRVFFAVNERKTPLGSRERRVSIEDSISIARFRWLEDGSGVARFRVVRVVVVLVGRLPLLVALGGFVALRLPVQVRRAREAIPG